MIGHEVFSLQASTSGGQHDGVELHQVMNQEGKAKQFEDCKYKKIPLQDDGDLRKMTRNLVPEQMNVLRAILPGCKDIVKARKNIHIKPRQHLLIVHGGAGNIPYKLLLDQLCLMKNYF